MAEINGAPANECIGHKLGKRKEERKRMNFVKNCSKVALLRIIFLEVFFQQIYRKAEQHNRSASCFNKTEKFIIPRIKKNGLELCALRRASKRDKEKKILRFVIILSPIIFFPPVNLARKKYEFDFYYFLFFPSIFINLPAQNSYRKTRKIFANQANISQYLLTFFSQVFANKVSTIRIHHDIMSNSFVQIPPLPENKDSVRSTSKNKNFYIRLEHFNDITFTRRELITLFLTCMQSSKKLRIFRFANYARSKHRLVRERQKERESEKERDSANQEKQISIFQVGKRNV